MVIIDIVLALIGIGIIIFIHEAGHFMAAKKVGVRVERFAVGFDPPLRGRNLRFLAFTRGETEYVIGMIPFGGYVKMAGETLMAGDSQGEPGELVSKSVGARALVFAAGAIMNILSAVLLFVIAFSVGVRFPAPEVGTVTVGSPAWEAGIRSGDRVLKVNGDAVVDYTELTVAEALGTPTEQMEIELMRAGAQASRTVHVQPSWSATRGFHLIGVQPSVADEFETPPKDSPAEKAGVQKGDRPVALTVAGAELPRLPTPLLFSAYGELTDLRSEVPLGIKVERDGTEKQIQFPGGEQRNGKVHSAIGVWLSAKAGTGNVVRALRPGTKGTLSSFLKPGDIVVKISGQPVTTVQWLPLLDRFLRGETKIGLSVVNLNDGEPRSSTLRTLRVIEWLLLHDIQWDRLAVAIPPLDPGSALTNQDVRENDRVVKVGDALCFSAAEVLEKLDSQSHVEFVPVTFLRNTDLVTINMPVHAREALRLTAKDDFAPLPGVFQGGPADSAGMRAGDVILAVGDDPVNSWAELSPAVRKHAPGTSVDVKWRTPSGEIKEAPITVGMAERQPLGVGWTGKTKVITVGILDAFKLGLHRTVVVTKLVFLTLRSLVRREVSAKNLAGPIGITHLLTKISEQRSLGTMLYWLALISVNLGLFNLLPFPVLDGGHLMFLLIEKIKGSPVDIRIQEWATNVAFLLILALAVFVTFNDVVRLFQ